MRPLIEVAIDDVNGAVIAEKLGIERVEVCAELSVGGLTPSIGFIEEILAKTSTIELAFMVRPRSGNFTYSPEEVATMVRDIETICKIDFGSRPIGFVFGALTADGHLDIPTLKQLIAAKSQGTHNFHMAFDATENLEESLRELITLGFSRVLTSGGDQNALAGAEPLKRLKSVAAGKIRIIAGGGVRPYNVRDILDASGAEEIHLRAQEIVNASDGSKYGGIPVARTSERVLSNLLSSLEKKSENFLLAVDLGGTSIKGALLTTSHEIKFRAKKSTKKGEIYSDLKALITELLEAARDRGALVLSIGVITPGSIDETSGMVFFASNLGLKDFPLGEYLQRDFNLPVAVFHDVRGAALGECTVGSSRGISHFTFVSIGTGIATGNVVDGKVIKGATQTAGEAGHMPLVVDGPICPCGQRGCWERYSGGDGIAERYFELTGAKKSAEEIINSSSTDADAAKVWHDAIARTAQALAIITMNFDPARIVIGGGVATAYGASLSQLQSEVKRLVVWRKAPEILISDLGADAGIYGASVVALLKN